MRTVYVAAGVGVVSLTIGVASGYFLTKRMLDAKYNEKMEAEIQRTRDHYAKTMTKEYSTPEEAVEALLDGFDPDHNKHAFKDDEGRPGERLTVEKIDYTKFSIKPEDLEYEPNAIDVVADQMRKAVVEESEDSAENVFEKYSDEKWMENRDPSKPYIISEEEFLANDPEFDQTQLTYFAGDKQLADDNRQDPIPNHSIVGEDNLEHFGVGSDDPHLLYIRNEKLKADFEISLSQGYYQREVLGLDIQEKYLKHSDHRVRKNRPAWDD
jgi:hypothetical protein